MTTNMITIDANEATALVAHKVNEVIAIYPITPSSGMGELADQYSAHGDTNIWGAVPLVIEMQSEGGAAGAVHGALQTGALTTTFTASQGLLLMIPNMFKIAGELTATTFHVAARSLAAQGLSIFGDHSDVMATRNTGFALLCSNSVQEAMDMALIAHAATLRARVPFIHFFDGFRTSHEINKIAPIDETVMRAMIDDDLVRAHRDRALSPDHPIMRGTAQNPDVYFQARESANPYYIACPGIVQQTMDKFAELTGRQYHLFDYIGAPDAERVIVLMGSGAEAVEETVEYLAARGEKIGAVKVRLYRPFDTAAFVNALPPTTKSIAVLDRCKEPGGIGEPLYLDVVSALVEHVAAGNAPFAIMPRIIGGRYGLSSKEFTPPMIKAVYDELAKPVMKNHFTVGIDDDVTYTSLVYDDNFSTESDDVVRAVFFGLGSDGTVGANKNSIKIIGENTPNFAQGYFVLDSKKSGSVTVSHLRFGPRPFHSPYLISRANFVACHQFGFLERFDMLKLAQPGATFLLNSPYGPDEVWDYLPQEAQQAIIDKGLHFYVVDALAVADKTNMGRRINTVMQTCFFALIEGATSVPLLSRERAIAEIKEAIAKTYGKRGETVVEQNYAAVDASLSHLHEVTVPAMVSSSFTMPPVVASHAPAFIQNVTARMMAGLGDLLPVSALPVDGTYPTGTTQWEKRNIATEVPEWDEEICIQCGKCALVCPHGVIRLKIYDPANLENAPEAFKSTAARFKEYKDMVYTLQPSVEDCTGCTLCYEVCPVKNKRQPKYKAINMIDYTPAVREQERANWDFFQELPNVERTEVPLNQVKYNQLLEPLFEFSGACAGCGETPYLKLVTQLFGDRMVVANATGCSSIYGGNLPTTPWAKNAEGRGPAWSNSLFEDNAEFGLGMRVALDQRLDATTNTLRNLREVIGTELAHNILYNDQVTETDILHQRKHVQLLKERLQAMLAETDPKMEPLKPALSDLLSKADALVKKSVWIIGGDGWAYDIGYGGLDHVLASGRNVNILVLDTEVYSNTGGQMSKSTPRGAVAKFAAAGKPLPKKDLGMLAMTYGNVYVARVAFGANDKQTVQALLEAEAYDGPSLIIAYSHCIAHGYDMKFGLEQQQAAVDSGHWVLYRYNPELAHTPVEATATNDMGAPSATGAPAVPAGPSSSGSHNGHAANPFQLDSKAPSLALDKYIYREGRYRMLQQSNPEAADRLLKLAKADVAERWKTYQRLAAGDKVGE